MLTPKGVKSLRVQIDFCLNSNEKNEVVRYKVQLMAQGFSQRPSVDYMKTYSLIVDANTLGYLISTPMHENLICA